MEPQQEAVLKELLKRRMCAYSVELNGVTIKETRTVCRLADFEVDAIIEIVKQFDQFQK